MGAKAPSPPTKAWMWFWSGASRASTPAGLATVRSSAIPATASMTSTTRRTFSQGRLTAGVTSASRISIAGASSRGAEHLERRRQAGLRTLSNSPAAFAIGRERAMPSIRLPLSGDVSQVINPQSWTTNAGQIGFFNVDLGSSGDPDVERSVIADVVSYGRQLGRLGDVVAILLKHIDRTKLTEQEQAQIGDFETQLRAVDRVKQRRSG